MPTPIATFTKAASSLLTPSPTWEGTPTIGERRYTAFLVGDKTFNTYTLDLASGHIRLKLNVRQDGSWLCRRGDERGWTVATSEEVALAHTVVLTAANDERSRKQLSHPAGTRAFVREAATRALLIAAFAFALLALL